MQETAHKLRLLLRQNHSHRPHNQRGIVYRRRQCIDKIQSYEE